MKRTAALAFTLLFAAGCAGDTPTDVAPPSDGAASFRTVGPGVHEVLTPDVRAELAMVRRMTARFHDIDAAMAAGYTVWSPDPATEACQVGVNAADGRTGRMGYHLVNPHLENGDNGGGAANPAAADAQLDVLHPERLLYETRPDGKLHLVGVEYLVFRDAWDAAHGGPGAAAPVLFGREMVHGNHTFPPVVTDHPVPHYELHVWVWKPDPSGMFAQFNPNVTC